MRLLDFLEENGYDQLVTGPTRRGGTSDNLLDLVISHRDSLAVQVHDIINVPFSDHRLISFTADLPKIMVRTVTYSYRDYRKIDLLRFMNIIGASSLFTSPPTLANDFAKQLDETVTVALDTVAPLQTRTKRTSCKSLIPWITPVAKDAKCLARRLERRYRKTKAEEDYVLWRKAGRNAVREMNNARTQYYQNAVLSASSEPRSLWSTVKKILHSKPTSPALDLKLARKRAIDFLAYFNDKLAKIRSTIATNLTGIVCTPLPPLSSPPPSLSVFSSPVTVSEVSLLIKSLSTSKSAPVDVIPVALLKSCSSFLASTGYTF